MADLRLHVADAAQGCPQGYERESGLKFFDWGFEKGQKMATDIAFGPLPPSTVAAIKAYWKANLGIELSSAK